MMHRSVVAHGAWPLFGVVKPWRACGSTWAADHPGPWPSCHRRCSLYGTPPSRSYETLCDSP
eukprot:364465-Chlamydomonas_euryale.AAC.4